MRYAIQSADGVELRTGSTPLPIGAVYPVPNWDDLIAVPNCYRKIVGDQVLEMTQEEIDNYDTLHPPTVEELQEEAQIYLDDTDWYVIRYNDPSGGDTVPQEILNGRAEARELL